jgi:hypothetical protein
MTEWLDALSVVVCFLPALAPGLAISERAVGGGLRMVVFDSRSASAQTRSLTICAGVPGAPRYH